jgi:hypothetical protein
MVRFGTESTEYSCVARCSALNGELPRIILPNPLITRAVLASPKAACAPADPAKSGAAVKTVTRAPTAVASGQSWPRLPAPPSQCPGRDRKTVLDRTKKLDLCRTWPTAKAPGKRDVTIEWRVSLPGNFEGLRLADKLQAIVDFDLDELRAIAPPHGHGRD